MRDSKINYTVAAVVFILAAYGLAGPIKTWSNGERLTASDLNSNFAHIHNEMVGSEGPRLVDADVAGAANISYTKIQNGASIPRAWAAARACDGGACAFSGSGVTSIANSGKGQYSVTLTTNLTNTNYGVTVSGTPPTGSSFTYSNGPWPGCIVIAKSATGPHVTIYCMDMGHGYGGADGGTMAVQADFDFAVFDND